MADINIGQAGQIGQQGINLVADPNSPNLTNEYLKSIAAGVGGAEKSNEQQAYDLEKQREKIVDEMDKKLDEIKNQRALRDQAKSMSKNQITALKASDKFTIFTSLVDATNTVFSKPLQMAIAYDPNESPEKAIENMFKGGGEIFKGLQKEVQQVIKQFYESGNIEDQVLGQATKKLEDIWSANGFADTAAQIDEMNQMAAQLDPNREVPVSGQFQGKPIPKQADLKSKGKRDEYVADQSDAFRNFLALQKGGRAA